MKWNQLANWEDCNLFLDQIRQILQIDNLEKNKQEEDSYNNRILIVKDSSYESKENNRYLKTRDKCNNSNSSKYKS